MIYMYIHLTNSLIISKGLVLRQLHSVQCISIHVTVYVEIFMVKIFCVANFRSVKFSWASYPTKILHNEKFPHDTFDATNLQRRYKQNTWLSTREGSVFVDTTFTRSYPLLARIAPYFKAHRGTVCLIWSALLLILDGLGSYTLRFASAITDDSISEESGPFESSNPLIGFKYLRSTISWWLGWLKKCWPMKIYHPRKFLRVRYFAFVVISSEFVHVQLVIVSSTIHV